MTGISRRTFGLASIGVGAGMLLSAGHGRAQDTGVIRLGLTTALTGPYNEFGEGNKRGFDLAVEQWNARGGIHGKRIEIVTALDDQMVPDRAAQNMRRLLDDPSLVGILGPAGSGPTMAVIDMATADGRPYINPLAQATAAVYANGLDKAPRANVFHFGVLSPVESEVLATFVAKTYKKIGLMNEGTAYGVGNRDNIVSFIKAARADAEIVTESYNQRAADVTAQLVRIQRAGVDVVVVVGLGTDLVTIRRGMVRLGLQQPLVTSGGGLSLPYLEGAGEAAVGTIAPLVSVLVEDNPRPEVTQFIASYKKKYGVDRYWGPNPERPQVQMSLIVIPAFDGVNVLLEGLNRANSTEPAKVIAAIESLTNYPGVNGIYSFSKQRHHSILPESLSMLRVVKKGDRVGLEVVKS